MKLLNFISIYLFSFLICFSISCQQKIDISINTTRISNRAILFDCLYTKVIALASKKGIVIIDTHRSPSIMLEIKKLIEKEFGRNDYIYVINTHGHWDHSSGNQVFHDSILLGHKNCPEFMRQNPANTLQNLWFIRYRLSKLQEELRNLQKDSQESKNLKMDINAWNLILADLEDGYITAPPTRTFDDSLTLDLDDLTIKLIYCGDAHTNNDIFVFIPEEKIVVIGDMFSDEDSYSFSINKMIDIPKVASAINLLLNQNNEIKFVISTHTEFLSVKDLKSIKNILVERYAEFEKKKSAAVFLKSMIEEKGIKSALEIYDELKSESTTKYYFLEDEFNTLGGRLLDQGKINDAIEVFKITVKIYPNSALVYDNLAEAYLKKGKKILAIKNYKKSLEIFPGNRNAREILKIINN